MASKQEDILLIKLALGAMAAEEGKTHAQIFFTSTLKGVADVKVQMMVRRLAEIRGMGPGAAIQLLAQLGWFLSQAIDNASPSVL